MSNAEKDLNLLGLSSFTMDKIKNMKKSDFMNMVKRRVNKLEHSEINSKISAAKPIRNVKKKKLN